MSMDKRTLKRGQHKQTCPRVEVTWVDATSHSGWFDISEMREKQPVTMYTLGYLTERNKNYVKMVRSIEAEGYAIGDVFTIPTGWIKRIKRLK